MLFGRALREGTTRRGGYRKTAAPSPAGGGRRLLSLKTRFCVASWVPAPSQGGTQIEGNEITPNIAVTWSFVDALEGCDNQLATASQALNGSH
jgi:hypothetical protein